MFHLLPSRVHTTPEFYSLKDKKPDKYIEANRFFVIYAHQSMQ